MVLKPLAGWFRSNGRGSGATTQALRAAARGLQDWSRESESGFLAVLQSLESHLGAARALAGECETAVQAGAEGEAAAAEEQLQAALERTGAAQSELGCGGQLLEEAAGRIRSLEERAARMAPAVRTFHVLGVCIRMERERLGEAGADFEGLAGEVGQLATDLGGKAEAISGACQDVRRQIAGALAAAQGMERRRLEELPRIVESSTAGLVGLTWRRKRAAERSRQMGEGFHAISADIAGMVSALQYHDITRQRMEHVVEALEEAAGGRAGRGVALAGVARLQAAQMEAAAAEYAAAVGQIAAGLRRVSGQALEMAGGAQAGARSLPGGEGEGLAELEQQFGQVVEAMGEFAASSAELRRTEAAVVEALRPVAEFAGGLERTGLRIQLAAVNASVKAAHLGADGAALAAVADAIQTTAAESARLGEEALSELGAVQDCAVRLAQNARAGGTMQSGGGLAGQLRAVLAALRGAAEDSAGRRAALERRARELSLRVASLAGELEADARLERAVRAAAEAMESIAGPEPGGAAEVRLERLRERYTMETERALHDELVGGGALPASPESGGEAVAAAAGSGFGDNVELF